MEAHDFVFKGIDGTPDKKYRLLPYSISEAIDILYQTVGTLAKKATRNDILICKTFLNHGFKPLFCCYGNNSHWGELYPLVSWFSFTGINEKDADDTIDIKINYSVDKEKNPKFTVYEAKDRTCKIGVFNNLDDVLRLYKIDNYIPAICVPTEEFKQKMEELVLNQNEDPDRMIGYIKTNGEIKCWADRVTWKIDQEALAELL